MKIYVLMSLMDYSPSEVLFIFTDKEKALEKYNDIFTGKFKTYADDIELQEYESEKYYTWLNKTNPIVIKSMSRFLDEKYTTLKP